MKKKEEDFSISCSSSSIVVLSVFSYLRNSGKKYIHTQSHTRPFETSAYLRFFSYLVECLVASHFFCRPFSYSLHRIPHVLKPVVRELFQRFFSSFFSSSLSSLLFFSFYFVQQKKKKIFFCKGRCVPLQRNRSRSQFPLRQLFIIIVYTFHLYIYRESRSILLYRSKVIYHAIYIYTCTRSDMCSELPESYFFLHDSTVLMKKRLFYSHPSLVSEFVQYI